MNPEASSAPVRRVQRVRHELHRRDVEVVRVEPMGPHFVAVTFHAQALADFRSDGFDDHVKFMIDDDATGETVRRDYTPRRFDAVRRELTIEFALHGDGPAADWARKAQVGQRALIGGPRGSMIVPTDYDWHLLVGDDSALPAIHRRLEELPAGTRAIVIAQAVEPSARRELASAASLEVQWVENGEAMVQALRALTLPEGEGYAWCAGEAAVMAQLRGVLLAEKQHPKESMKVAVYWKPGAADFHETLEA
ncbi:siderophore-interacting protein [Variovorax sp. OV329]|uniref:siderophore-interacting protein n=1 Tax=Variovorax sp. OV329 TaxID=1882825 RepID=UPI0008E10F9D|nr:siderophore-interacting protein [Variovorax sp. OV329]SFN30822.1 NADPH-dependent ferric siderophore reductase, contains FAD-binding and SIP domains [Variovorax sp. OV329]